MSNIGQLIKELRIAQNMNQESLAAGICSRGYISSIEKGNTTPSFEILDQIAQKLNTTVDELNLNSEADNEYLLKEIFLCIEINSYPEAIDLWSKLSISSDTCPLCVNWVVGKLAEYKKEFNKAIEHYNKALTLSVARKNVHFEIRSLNALGALNSRALNKPIEGAEFLNRAFELIQMHDVTGPIRISVLVDLGNTCLRLAEIVLANRYFGEALELLNNYQLDYRRADALMGYGIVNGMLLQFEKAIYYTTMAKEIYETEQSDSELLVGCLVNLGKMYREIKKYDLSKDHLSEAIEKFKQLDFPWAIDNAKIELALTHKVKGDIEQSKQILESVMISPFIDRAAEAKMEYSLILLEEGKEDDAIQCLIEAESGLLDVDHFPLVRMYSLLGELLMKQGKFEEAAKYLQKYSALTKQFIQLN